MPDETTDPGEYVILMLKRKPEGGWRSESRFQVKGKSVEEMAHILGLACSPAVGIIAGIAKSAGIPEGLAVASMFDTAQQFAQGGTCQVHMNRVPEQGGNHGL